MMHNKCFRNTTIWCSKRKPGSTQTYVGTFYMQIQLLQISYILQLDCCIFVATRTTIKQLFVLSFLARKISQKIRRMCQLILYVPSQMNTLNTFGTPHPCSFIYFVLYLNMFYSVQCVVLDKADVDKEETFWCPLTSCWFHFCMFSFYPSLFHLVTP